MIQVRPIPAQDTWALRKKMLRPQATSLTECHFAGDEHALHIGAFLEGQLVGVATFMREGHPELGPAKHPVRLRGMATDQDFHRRGIGRKLVQEGETLLRNEGCDRLWFNAREAAFAFYEALGYAYLGEIFDIPTVGPHKVMYKVFPT